MYTALVIGIFGIIHLPLTHTHTHTHTHTYIFMHTSVHMIFHLLNNTSILECNYECITCFLFSIIYYYIIKKDRKSGLFANFSLIRN